MGWFVSAIFVYLPMFLSLYNSLTDWFYTEWGEGRGRGREEFLVVEVTIIASLLLGVLAQGRHCSSPEVLNLWYTSKSPFLKYTCLWLHFSEIWISESGEGPECAESPAGIMSYTSSSKLQVWTKHLTSFPFPGPFSQWYQNTLYGSHNKNVSAIHLQRGTSFFVFWFFPKLHIRSFSWLWGKKKV